MDIEELHKKYRELDKAQIIKEGDSVNFSDVKNEIERIYQWESDYYNAVDYRNQLPEEDRRSIENEFATILSQLNEIAILRNTDISNLAQTHADKVNSIKNLYRTIYGVFTKDYRSWVAENQGTVYSARIEGVAKQAEEKLIQQAKQAEEQLTIKAKQDEEKLAQKGEQEVSKIVGSETTQEWAREYSKYINQDQIVRNKLNRIKKKCEQKQDERNGRTKRIRNFFTRSICMLSSGYISRIQGTIFYEGHSYLNASARWRFWRSIFFFILFALAIFYFLHFLLAGAPPKDKLFDYFIEKLVFLPLIVVTTVGLTFASRNYRINSKLLEDYKHRYVVAKTIQNLLLLPTIKKNTSMQNQLLTVGTSILFEHRASGYMGKDSDEKLLENLISSQIASLKGKK